EVELGSDLGSDFFTVLKVNRKSETLDPYVLTLERTKTHLYNLALRIPASNVLEAVEVKVGAEVQIHNVKNVFFKGGGHSLRIVVRSDQATWVLDEVRANQHVLTIV